MARPRSNKGHSIDSHIHNNIDHDIDHDGNIDASRVKRYRSMGWVKDALGSRVPDGSDLLDEDIIDLIRQRETVRDDQVANQALTKKLKAAPGLDAQYRVSEGKIKRTAAKILQDFDAPTENDRFSVWLFATNIETIKVIDSQLNRLRPSVTDPDIGKAFSALASEKKTLMTENRELQNVLGIGRKVRIDSKQNRSVVDDHIETMRAAKEFIEQNIVRIICPVCHTEDGWLYNLFRDLEWGHVARCGCGVILMVRAGAEEPVVIDDAAFQEFLKLIRRLGGLVTV